MGLVAGLGNLVDELAALVEMRLLKRPLAAYCDLETADSDVDLVASDGSLMSVIEISGSKGVLGDAEWQALIDDAERLFAPFLQRKGCALQFYFEFDPEAGPREVRNANAAARHAAAASNLDVEELLAEREEVLPRYIAAERCYMALWTRPGVLSKDELSKAKARAREQSGKAPLMQYGQWPLGAYEILRSRHSSLVRSVLYGLSKMGILARVLEVHDALREVRGTVYPTLRDSPWSARLPGDVVPMRAPEKGYDVSDLLWPALRTQMFPQGAEEVDSSVVRIGDRLFAGVNLDVPPEMSQPLTVLLRAVRNADPTLPWRISFLVEGGGLRSLGMKSSLASVLSWANTDNKRIYSAVKGLRALETANSALAFVRLRITLATWCHGSKGKDTAYDRLYALLRAVEGWGNCEVSSNSGDPLDGTMSSALGLSCASTAQPAVAPLGEITGLFPLGRPASPFEKGVVMFRGPDGKLWPYMPGSAQQIAWIELVAAPMGSGKSVLLNTINLGSCLAPQTFRGSDIQLPLVRIIDIGPSSSGLIGLLKDALPRHRKHEAAYIRPKMNEDYAVNPFDTQLGCRWPLPHEKDAIANLLIHLCTPVGDDRPYDGIPQLVSIVIDEVYRWTGDTNPRIYTPGIDRVVDEALRENRIDLPVRATWWEVVDLLIGRGRFHEASLAQRYAVPLMSDLAAVVSRSPQVNDLMGSKRAPTQETIVEAFGIFISAACRDYPILSRPTRFDIGGARVCVMDLDEVARGAGPKGRHQNAVMYMLARHILTRDLFLNREDLPYIPEGVRGYHERRITEIRDTMKRLVYDEYHRVSSPSVRGQTMLDIREGRKWGIQICLSSQLLEDFDREMIELGTSFFILGAGSGAAMEFCAAALGMSETGMSIVRHQLRGPGPGGAPFLAVMKLKSGRYEQLLYNTLGPVELWAFSTTAEDVGIRRRLYDAIGRKRALRLLARAFPDGTAKGEVERRQLSLRETGTSGEDGASILDDIAGELLRRFDDEDQQTREKRT